MAINRNTVDDLIAAAKDGITQLDKGKAGDFEFDLDLDVEVQTDKEQVKIVPCRECHRPLVVTTFFAPAKAICGSCSGKGKVESSRAVATVGQPVPGETDPAKAVDLVKCLVNPSFAQVLCPVNPADEDHVMKLVSVVHSDNYGPSEMIGWKNGVPQYRQLAVGETVSHQCQKCKAMVTYTTMRQTLLRAINEPRQQPDTGRRPGFTLETLQGTVLEEQ